MAKKLSKPDLFEALGYKPHPGQILVHRSTAPRRVLACGVRFGKSTCAVMEACAALLQPREECLGWTIAPTLDLARLIFERTAMTLHRKFKHRVKLYSPREQRLVVVNFGGGLSVLEGKTADNPVSLLGEALDFAIIDEAARIKENVYTEHVSQRLVDREGWVLMLSTPRGADNWFFQQHRRGQKGRDPAYASWQSPSWSNPYLDRELIEAERSRLDADTFNEQYGAVFLGEELQPCDTCHGPNAHAVGIVLILPDKPPMFCPECRDYVNEKGESLVRRGRTGGRCLTIMNLSGRRDGTKPTVQLPASLGASKPTLIEPPEQASLQVDAG